MARQYYADETGALTVIGTTAGANDVGGYLRGPDGSVENVVALTSVAYNELASKNPKTLYFLTDAKATYLGTTQVSFSLDPRQYSFSGAGIGATVGVPSWRRIFTAMTPTVSGSSGRVAFDFWGGNDSSTGQQYSGQFYGIFRNTGGSEGTNTATCIMYLDGASANPGTNLRIGYTGDLTAPGGTVSFYAAGIIFLTFLFKINFATSVISFNTQESPLTTEPDSITYLTPVLR
jgi:hypothetical protein